MQGAKAFFKNYANINKFPLTTAQMTKTEKDDTLILPKCRINSYKRGNFATKCAINTFGKIFVTLIVKNNAKI